VEGKLRHIWHKPPDVVRYENETSFRKITKENSRQKKLLAEKQLAKVMFSETLKKEANETMSVQAAEYVANGFSMTDEVSMLHILGSRFYSKNTKAKRGHYILPVYSNRQCHIQRHQGSKDQLPPHNWNPMLLSSRPVTGHL
jgi:hypothetical protein